MKAIKITFKGRIDDLFTLLLNDDYLKDCYYDVIHWESYGQSTMTIDFNKIDNIDSALFVDQLITNKFKVKPEFLQLYISNENIKKDIWNYLDFKKSQYFLSIAIIDHSNIEIISKKEDILWCIIKNFKERELSNLKVQIFDEIPDDSVISIWRKQEDISVFN